MKKRTGNVVFAPPDFDGSMMDPDGAKKSERLMITVQGSGPLFKKKSILLFACQKERHLTIGLFAFHKAAVYY